MHRRKRRILNSLVLGFAVAAFAAPTAVGEPRGDGNSPNHPDFWNYNVVTGDKVANTSPGVAPADLARMYDGGGSAVGSSGVTAPQLDPLIADAIRAHQNEIAVGSDDRSFYRGTTPQLDPSVVLSPDDRNVYRGVETDVPLTVTLSPAIKGELVKTMERPSVAPVSGPTISVSTDDGFQWVDAGLGAASTLALVLLMGAATLMLRHQRRRLAAY